MKTRSAMMSAAGAIAFVVCAALASHSIAQTVPPLAKSAGVPELPSQAATGFKRSFVQQPPMVPHSIENFRLDLGKNECVYCHDRLNEVVVKAPKMSSEHYLDRDGAKLQKVSGARYFCYQCHTPMTNEKPLVGNRFRNASGK